VSIYVCTLVNIRVHALRFEGCDWYIYVWCERCLLITESPKTPGHFRYLIWVLHTYVHMYIEYIYIYAPTHVNIYICKHIYIHWCVYTQEHRRRDLMCVSIFDMCVNRLIGICAAHEWVHLWDMSHWNACWGFLCLYIHIILYKRVQKPQVVSGSLECAEGGWCRRNWKYVWQQVALCCRGSDGCACGLSRMRNWKFVLQYVAACLWGMREVVSCIRNCKVVLQRLAASCGMLQWVSEVCVR